MSRDASFIHQNGQPLPHFIPAFSRHPVWVSCSRRPVLSCSHAASPGEHAGLLHVPDRLSTTCSPPVTCRHGTRWNQVTTVFTFLQSRPFWQNTLRLVPSPAPLVAPQVSRRCGAPRGKGHRQRLGPRAESGGGGGFWREDVLFLEGERGWQPSSDQVLWGPAEAWGTARGWAHPPGPPGGLAGQVRTAGSPPPPPPGPGPHLSLAAVASVGRGGLLQAQQLPHQSLAKLRPAVPLYVVGVGQLVENVGVVDGDADGEPEHLLPGLVWFVRNEIPTRTEE